LGNREWLMTNHMTQTARTSIVDVHSEKLVCITIRQRLVLFPTWYFHFSPTWCLPSGARDSSFKGCLKTPNSTRTPNSRMNASAPSHGRLGCRRRAVHLARDGGGVVQPLSDARHSRRAPVVTRSTGAPARRVLRRKARPVLIGDVRAHVGRTTGGVCAGVRARGGGHGIS